MNFPKVSIIVPVFNAEKYLRQCLDSAKNQTMTDIEIICIDDGSTDNSVTILDEYALQDKRFIIVHQSNSGQSVARNKGLEIAHGKYIAFLDSDDYYDLRLCQVAYTIAEKNEADIVSFSYREIGGKQRIIPKKTQKKTDSDYSKYCHVCDTMFVVWSRLYCRQFLLENNLLFPEKMCYEDNYYSTISFLKAKNVIFIPEVLYNYRIGVGYTHDMTKCHGRMTYIEMQKKISDEIVTINISDQVKFKILGVKYSGYSHFYRRIIPSCLKIEGRQRMLSAIEPWEWELIDSWKIPMNIKTRCFLYWLRDGWLKMLKKICCFR